MDVQNLNNAAIGVKTQVEKSFFDAWAADGEFVPLSLPYGMHETIYLPPHLQCSLFLSSLQTAKRGRCKDHCSKYRCKEMQGPLKRFTATFFCDDYGLAILYEERGGDQTEYYKLLLE